MRIMSGKYKGKQLQGFNIEGTRPTMDRIKKSLFSMIQTKIQDSDCLDLFAGSGALGIEALSMGAKSCTFVDNNPQIIQILKHNTSQIKETYKIINIDYKKYLKNTKEKYDIIFLDPPYEKSLNKTLKCIEEYDLLNENGIIVCEYENNNPLSNYPLIKMRKYGSKYIKIYKK